MTKHTPGPWYACGRTVSLDREGLEMLTQVARVTVHRGEITGEAAEANARLIAAAPEQNAALLSAPEPGPWCGTSKAGLLYADWWRDIRGAAIAKAEGR